MDKKIDEILKKYPLMPLSLKIELLKDFGIYVKREDIKDYKPTMKDNYDVLEKRVFESLDKSNIDMINKTLRQIKEPMITSGVGGSFVVSNFASKVLSKKNNIISQNTTLRDINYLNLDGYKNILVCSYGGMNYGVENAFKCNLNKYLLSRNEIDGINNIKYYADLEKSFISLSSTLIPITILLQYYLDGDIKLIKEILNDRSTIDIKNANNIEVLSGHETSTAHSFLESTFVESGMANITIHDKYDYCHGRSNLNYKLNNNNILLFNNKTELDMLYLNELKNYYENVYVIDKKYEDDIVNDYYLTYKCMLLCEKIANDKDIDLSNFKYSPFVKKLYFFKGEM